MADSKITGLPASAGLVDADLVEVVDDVAGTPASQKATIAQVRSGVLGTVPLNFEITFGDGDTSIREASDDQLYFQGASGSDIFRILLTGAGAVIEGLVTGQLSMDLVGGAYGWRLDGDTRIRRPAADVIAVDCGGTEAQRFDSAGMIPPLKSSAAAPTATECPAGHLVTHKNTTTGIISLVYNDGGTIHTVALAAI
jgi:hypothetical protein